MQSVRVLDGLLGSLGRLSTSWSERIKTYFRYFFLVNLFETETPLKVKNKQWFVPI